MNKTIVNMLNRVNRKSLKNNTQRVLVEMLSRTPEWVEGSALRIPSASSRLRDLRTREFGGFTIECRTARQLGKRVKDGARRFYRLDPRSVTVERLNRVLEGVITTSK